MKVDVTVSKKMTINSGNYSSLQPSVSITLKDVDMENYKDNVYDLTVLVDSLFTENLIEHSEYMQVIKDHGLPRALEAIDKEMMKNETESAIKRLTK
jgi:hypothetical protein